MKELFSRSKSSGEPFTAAGSPPTPLPASVRAVTSCVVTKPPEVPLSRNTTPLPLMTVGSPPPPPLPATPVGHERGVGPEKAVKLPPPWPIQPPAVRVGQELGAPPVHRSKSVAVS